MDRRTFIRGALVSVPAASLTACDLPPEGDGTTQRISSALSFTEETPFGPFGGDGAQTCGDLCNGFYAPPFPQAADGSIDESEKRKGRLRRCIIRSGKYIDGMDFHWQDDSGNIVANRTHYGGWGGGRSDATDLFLAPDELIVKAVVGFGKYVRFLRFETNFGQVRSWGTFIQFMQVERIELPAGHGFHGFSGIHGKYIDAITLWSYRIQ